MAAELALMGSSRWCTNCGEEKLFTEFNSGPQMGGVRSFCKICSNGVSHGRGNEYKASEEIREAARRANLMQKPYVIIGSKLKYKKIPAGGRMRALYHYHNKFGELASDGEWVSTVELAKLRGVTVCEEVIRDRLTVGKVTIYMPHQQPHRMRMTSSSRATKLTADIYKQFLFAPSHLSEWSQFHKQGSECE